MPDTQPIRVPSSSQRVAVAATPAAEAGRSLRHGDLRRRRRSHQASGDAGPLQPRAQQGAAGKLRPDRHRPRARDCRTVARQPLRHAEDLCRQRRLGIRRRQHRRGGVGAAGGADDVHLRRFHQARDLRQHPRRAGQGGEGAWHEGQRHLLPGCRRPLLRHRRRPARQGEAHPAGRRRCWQAVVLAPRRDREAVRPQRAVGARAQCRHPAQLAEDQIFRIDHFLGKDTVQSIMAFRFANGLFEPIWNRDRIDHVQITASETVGVELRGGFYEATGALRDMVPNHVFTLLSMVAMEPPSCFDAEAIRTKKADVFAAMPSVKPAKAVRGQYGARRRAGLSGEGLSRTSRGSRRIRIPRPMSRWNWRSTTGAGPGCRSTSAPASTWPSG